MSDFILIFIGIFILILIILIFTLLAYVYNTYVSYTIEINKNLNDSEVTINKTNDAFNKLQDTVVDNIATVKTNQEKILENNKGYLNTLDSNLLSIMKIKNDNNIISSIISSNLNKEKTIDLELNTPITTYKNINALTNSNQYVNICNNETDPTKRKCVNMNIDSDGIFNIYSKNQLSKDAKSNIPNIAIRDNNNNILASFNGENNIISLGSNINPAIKIQNNIYTPDIIVCNYYYYGDATSPYKLNISFISNIPISKDVFINFPLLDNIISTIDNNPTISGLTSYLYTPVTKILKIKVAADILKNVITSFNIGFSKNISAGSVNESIKYNTNGYITID
jgi:hypothetical protein